MTTPEREALLKLWERVPECRPPGIYPSATTDGYWDDVNDQYVAPVHAAALARDAIVEWLIGKGEDVMQRADVIGAYVGLSVDLGTTYRKHREAPTRLLALIAAANAVADNA